MGVAPCERQLPKTINPIDQFHDSMTGGERQPINRSVSYLVGPALDQDSITTSTVLLRLASDGSPVPGLVSFFQFKDCDLALGSCPRGVGLSPNDGLTCDLQGDTLYELLPDGSALPTRTITFRTRPVPHGFTPSYCSAAPAWWQIDGLDPVDGLTLGITGDTPFIIIVTGVEAVGPWNGFDQPYEPTIALGVWDYNFSFSANTLANPPYVPLLVIQNSDTGSAYDLSLLPDIDRMIGMTDSNGNYVAVKLPTISIPADESLFLYVGANGSSYYAYDDSGTHTYTRSDQYPPYMLDPPTAFANAPAASW